MANKNTKRTRVANKSILPNKGCCVESTRVKPTFRPRLSKEQEAKVIEIQRVSRNVYGRSA